jgi:hypothetical protein
LDLDRRQLLSAAVASVLPAEAIAALSPTYAESAALDVFTPDATDEVAIRLGRFPGRGNATLWVTVCFGDQVYSAALDNLNLGAFRDRTPVETEKVNFGVFGAAEARMARTSNASLRGSVRVTAGAHETAEPPPGAGPVHVAIEATFESSHRPVHVRPGRMEVMGHANATVHIAGRTRRVRGYGKWHEQVGDRPRFAPAFTYFNVIGNRAGLLAVWRKAGAYGYAWTGDKIVAVKVAQFDPAAARRKFRVELEDGRTIEGEAVTERVISEPIEGSRRPGATVRVTSSLGPMTGHLNDWNPKD